MFSSPHSIKYRLTSPENATPLPTTVCRRARASISVQLLLGGYILGDQLLLAGDSNAIWRHLDTVGLDSRSSWHNSNQRGLDVDSTGLHHTTQEATQCMPDCISPVKMNLVPRSNGRYLPICDTAGWGVLHSLCRRHLASIKGGSFWHASCSSLQCLRQSYMHAICALCTRDATPANLYCSASKGALVRLTHERQQ